MIIIITPYNDAHSIYLTDCINSVRQNFNEDVVHDIQYDEGRGQAWAINKLLSRVNDKDIVGLLDADDMATPNMSLNVKFLDYYDVVYGDCMNMTSEDGGIIQRSQPMNFELFKKKNIIPASGTLIRGRIAKKGVYPDIFHGKDWHFWWSLTPYTKEFLYVEGITSQRRTWTSYKRCDIPVYRKLKRLYYDHQVKKLNRKYYVYTMQES